MKTFILVLISLFLISPPIVKAGKLDDFEESATSNEGDSGAPESHDDDDDDRYDDYDDYNDDPYENDSSIKDYDLGVHFGRRFGFLKVGYRWLESGDTNLDAAYIGASFWY